jgi:hypothetical protein
MMALKCEVATPPMNGEIRQKDRADCHYRHRRSQSESAVHQPPPVVAVSKSRG